MPQKKTRRQKIGGFLGDLIEGALDAATAPPGGSTQQDIALGINAARTLPMLRAAKMSEMLNRQDQAALRESQANLAGARAGFERERAGLMRESEENKKKIAEMQIASKEKIARGNRALAAAKSEFRLDESGEPRPATPEELSAAQAAANALTGAKTTESGARTELLGAQTETEQERPALLRAQAEEVGASTGLKREMTRLQERQVVAREKNAAASFLRATKTGGTKQPSPGTINSLHNQWNKKLDVLDKTRQAYQKMLRLSENPNVGANQLGVIYDFIHGLDNTAAREGEIRLAMSMQNLKNQIAGEMNRLAGQGGKLAPQTIKDFVNASRDMLASLEEDYEANLYPRFVSQAEAIGADPKKLIPPKRTVSGIRITKPVAGEFGHFRRPDGSILPATTAAGADFARKQGWQEVK